MLEEEAAVLSQSPTLPSFCASSYDQARSVLRGVLTYWPLPTSEHIPSLVFCGPTGSGKTFIVQQVLKELEVERKSAGECLSSLRRSRVLAPRVITVSPSLAEASVFRVSSSGTSLLRQTIYREVMKATTCPQKDEVGIPPNRSLIVLLEHLHIFCSGKNEASSSSKNGGTSLSSSQVALITDIFSILRSSPALFTREELETLKIQRVVIVGCFSSNREELHPTLARSFDMSFVLSTPTEKERQVFLKRTLSHSFLSTYSLSDKEGTLHHDTFSTFCNNLAMRSGGITYRGLVEVVSTLASFTHFHRLSPTVSAASEPQKCAASHSDTLLSAAVIQGMQNFQRSTSVAATLFRITAGYVDVPTTNWGDIAGLEEAKNTLQQVILLPLQNEEIYRLGGVRPSTGVLLYGPPGTGKTMLAKAMATELHASFVCIDLPSLIKAEVGESEKRLSAFFAAARERCPSVIFIDELQAAFGIRYRELSTERGGGKSSHESRLVSHLLQLIDAMHEDEGALVVIVGATNVKSHLDPLLLSAGRLDKHIAVPLPDIQSRRKLFELVIKGDWNSWFSFPSDFFGGLSATKCWMELLIKKGLEFTDSYSEEIVKPLISVIQLLLSLVQQRLMDIFASESEGLSGAELRNVTTIFATDFLQDFVSLNSNSLHSLGTAFALLDSFILQIESKEKGGAILLENAQHFTVSIEDSILMSIRRAVETLRQTKELSSSFY